MELSARPRARSATLAAAGLAGFGIVLFHRVVLGELLWFGDFHAAFEPLRGILGRELGLGLPLWNRSLSNGAPLLANPFAAALYPPNLLFALDGPLTARVLTLLAVLHAVWGALGAFLLARRLGLGPVGAFSAGLIFGFSGSAVLATYTVALASAAAWLPWVPLALMSMDDERGGFRSWGLAAFSAVLAVQFLAGEPFMLLSAALGGGLLVAFTPAFRRRAFVARAAGGSALALLAVSPWLLAVLRLLPATVRTPGLPYASIVERSVSPLDLLALFLPDPFGEAFRLGPDGSLASAFLGPAGLPVLSGWYVGGLAVAFALAGLRRRSEHRIALAVWLGLLLLLCLGRYGPVYPALWGLPGLDVLRFPGKWLHAAILPLALLAGEGVEAVDATPAPSRRPAGVIVPLLSILAALALVSAGAGRGLGALIAERAVPERRPPEDVIRAAGARLASSALRSAIPLAAAALVVLAPSARIRRKGALLAGLMGLDLLEANGSLAPTVSPSFYRDVPEAVKRMLADRPGRVWPDDRPATRGIPSRVPPGLPLTADLVRPRRERLDGYSGAAYGLDLAFNVDLEALSTRRYARLKRLVEALPGRERAMLLGAAGVTHVTTLDKTVEPHLTELARIDVGAPVPLRVLRNARALPRLRFVRELRAFGSVAEVPAILASGEDSFFESRALVDAADLPRIREALRAAPGAPGLSAARIIEERAGTLRAQTSGAGGFLVLSDTLVPGCFVEIDGREAPLHAADVAFRLVVVPAGQHRVVFGYSPWRSTTF